MKQAFRIGLAIMLSFAANSYGQRPAIQWSHFYGGSADDGLVHMIATSDSGYLLGGHTYSNDSDCVGNQGDRDYFVVKTDSVGTKQWSKVFGGSGLDGVNGIAETSDGFLIIGYTYSNDGDFISNHGPAGVSDFGVIKLDKQGNKVWTKCYGGTNYDEANYIIATSDGGFAFVGNSTSSDGDVKDHHGGTDAWFAKCDHDGSIQYSLSLGGTAEDQGHCVIETTNGFLVCGFTRSTDGNVRIKYGGADFFVALVNKNGLIWYKILGGSGDESYPIHGALDIDGLPVFVAATNSKDHDCSENHGGIDGFVFKLDLSGNLVWAHCIGGTLDEGFAGVCSDSFAIYAVGGTHDNFPQYHGGNDVFIAQLDHSGHSKSLWAFGGSSDDGGGDIKISPDGYLVVGGDSRSKDGDVNTILGGSNQWLFKLGCGGFNSLVNVSSNDVVNDTIGGTASLPIKIEDLPRQETVQMVLHYPSSANYIGTFDNANNQIGKEDWPGRSMITIQKAQSNQVSGWANFQVFTDSSASMTVTFDSLQVSDPGWSCLNTMPPPITATITSTANCGSKTISALMQGREPSFRIYPNPIYGIAMISLTSIERSNAGLASIS